MRTKSQLGWFNLPHSTMLPPPLTEKQRVVITPGQQPKEGTNGNGGKYVYNIV